MINFIVVIFTNLIANNFFLLYYNEKNYSFTNSNVLGGIIVNLDILLFSSTLFHFS